METIVATTDAHFEDVFAITNEAFLADAFFKKPEYVSRFDSLETVKNMNKSEKSAFLLLSKVNTNETHGSIYLSWDVDKEAQQVTGHFSCVSVRKTSEKQGIGKRLVKAAEDFIREVVASEETLKKIHVFMECGVINLRKDLFPWYEAQGYKIVVDENGQEVIEESEEVNMIKLEELIVNCVLMRKNLFIAS